jgi:hypothetical protein
MPGASVNLNKGVEACFAVPAISKVARREAVSPTGWLRDATGLWPVVLRDWGDQVIFRWSDLELKASRGRSARPDRNQGPSQQQQDLNQLLKSLFP